VADHGQGAGSRQVPVRWRPSAHGGRLLTVAVAALALAVLTDRPEFAGLAAPAVLLLSTLRAARPDQVTVNIRPADSASEEGRASALRIDLGGQGDYDAELRIEPGDAIMPESAVVIPALAPSAATQAVDGPVDGPVAGESRLRGTETRQAVLPFTAQRWGRRQIGILMITLRDRYGLTEGRTHLGLPWIDTRPRPAGLSRSILLSRLPSRLGEHPARATGEGGEFVGVREFVPGDRQRRINWPATTRRGTIHLSTFAAERVQNVVVIADATADVGEPGATSLDLVVRGATGVMTRYLANRDRVGLIVYASRLNWVPPGQGERHFQRLLDLLMSSPGGWDKAAGLTRLPRAALPPGALIVVFSPLLDPALVEAVRDVRERGFSVVIVDVLNSEPGNDGSKVSDLTRRVWRLEQQAIRFSMVQLGVPVVHWDGQGSLDDQLAPYTSRVMVVRR
jgi:uncharacterized protein (DUF58 family)